MPKNNVANGRPGLGIRSINGGLSGNSILLPWPASVGLKSCLKVKYGTTFLVSGEFLRKGVPDLHRPIGYPFLSLA